MQDDITDGVGMVKEGRHCRPQKKNCHLRQQAGGYATLAV